MTRRYAILMGAIVAAAPTVAPGRADEVAKSVHTTFTDSAGVMPASGASLHLHGAASAIRLDVRQTGMKSVLAALAATYGFSYRSSAALDQVVDGTYAGSLRLVLARLLKRYDYIIKEANSALELVILEDSGRRAMAAPNVAQIHQHRVPTTTRISRH
jgi:hypothetical protein